MKTCSKCMESKSLDDFTLHRKMKDGRRSDCRSCVNTQQRARRLAADPKRQRAIALLAEGKKNCRRCGETKPLDDFYSRPFSEQRDGREGRCKECAKALTAAWGAANTERKRMGDRRRRLKKQYGITSEQYDEMLSAQNGRCACCSAHVSDERWGVLGVDHDHDTGHVRGLLCDLCNTGIGRLGDTYEGVKRAFDYLLLHERMSRLPGAVEHLH